MNITKTGVALGIVVFAVSASGCSSSTSTPQAPATSNAAPSSSAAGLTQAQGTQICRNIQAWIPTANNAAPPRFSTTLIADMNEAQGSQLGEDLAGLNSDLLTQNTLALQDSASIPALSQDCATYGVTLNWQAGM